VWLAAVLAGGWAGENACAQMNQGPLMGRPAPAFHVQGIYGEPYSLESFKGHILILQFGASW
jgi:cytochrome oxidase Cu insertion factor (SCO1/SenC/PrrC family)